MLKVVLITCLFLFQSTSDDPENAAPEPGKPTHCDNYKQTPANMRCNCGRAMQDCKGMPQPPVDVKMDKRCKTYCRQQNCTCAGHGCRS